MGWVLSQKHIRSANSKHLLCTRLSTRQWASRSPGVRIRTLGKQHASCCDPSTLGCFKEGFLKEVTFNLNLRCIGIYKEK